MQSIDETDQENIYMIKVSAKNLGLILVSTLLAVSLASTFVAAQSYTTEQTTNVTIPSNGVFQASLTPSISCEITGTPGATGTVTAYVYSGNPQSTATIPSGTSLTYFIAVTFNMNAKDFTQATITVTYTDSEVQGLKQPYAIYKYIPDNNSYVALPSIVDTTAKTITVTLTSINDPLLAIGGPSSSKVTSSSIPSWTWAVVAVVIIVVVLIAVLLLTRMRRKASIMVVSND
jgi:hypothetical protein